MKRLAGSECGARATRPSAEHEGCAGAGWRGLARAGAGWQARGGPGRNAKVPTRTPFGVFGGRRLSTGYTPGNWVLPSPRVKPEKSLRPKCPKCPDFCYNVRRRRGNPRSQCDVRQESCRGVALASRGEMAPAGAAEARTERAVLRELGPQGASGPREAVPERDSGRHGARRPHAPRQDDNGPRGGPVQQGAGGDRGGELLQPRPHVHREGRESQRVRWPRPDLHHRPGPPSRRRRRRRHRRNPLRLGVLPGHQDHLRVGLALRASGHRGRPGNLVPRDERRQGPGD